MAKISLMILNTCYKGNFRKVLKSILVVGGFVGVEVVEIFLKEPSAVFRFKKTSNLSQVFFKVSCNSIRSLIVHYHLADSSDLIDHPYILMSFVDSVMIVILYRSQFKYLNMGLRSYEQLGGS